jgi:DNA-binding transcriptional regulator YdaS (Cro superfamily)
VKNRNPVLLAAKAAGNKRRLALLCGVVPQSVEDWQEREQIPARHILKIEKATGVPRHKLRPDLYPPADYAA